MLTYHKCGLTVTLVYDPKLLLRQSSIKGVKMCGLVFYLRFRNSYLKSSFPFFHLLFNIEYQNVYFAVFNGKIVHLMLTGFFFSNVNVLSDMLT